MRQICHMDIWPLLTSAYLCITSPLNEMCKTLNIDTWEQLISIASVLTEPYNELYIVQCASAWDEKNTVMYFCSSKNQNLAKT